MYVPNAPFPYLTLILPLILTRLIMRLLELKANGDICLTGNLINDIPPYAILSHTCGDDYDEVTFRSLTEGSGPTRRGYRKIQFCATKAHSDGLQYFWVDTFCIDKSNSIELSEAVNSMFGWYQGAAKCYVYLSDVSLTLLRNMERKVRRKGAKRGRSFC